MNEKVDEENGKALGKGNVRYRKIRRFSNNESWENIGCLVPAATFGLGGSRLWEKEEDIKISGKKRKRRSIGIKVYLYEVCLSEIIYYLLFYLKTILTPFPPCQISGIYPTREMEFKKYWPQGFELEEDKVTNDWWREKLLIDGFNAVCNNNDTSFLKVGDESMSKNCVQTTAKGNLTHFSYIFHKPEQLST